LFSHQVVINKGSANGVYKGQSVLDNRGILGQVMSVWHTTARVLLISDQSHSLSLRAERNDIRVLARGTGDLQRLELMFIPHSTELEVGDKLDRKSTRLNSSHVKISYAVFCLKKK